MHGKAGMQVSKLTFPLQYHHPLSHCSECGGRGREGGKEEGWEGKGGREEGRVGGEGREGRRKGGMIRQHDRGDTVLLIMIILWMTLH